MKATEITPVDESILESTSLESTLKTILTNSTHIVQVYETLKSMAQKWVNNNGNLNGFHRNAAGVGSRWFEQFYFNKLQKELYDLSKQAPRYSAPLVDFLKAASEGKKASFNGISEVLPSILQTMAVRMDNTELERFAVNWARRRADYLNYLDELENDDEDVPSTPTQPKTNVVGQQNTQIEQIINDVLATLPKNVAGEVRNAISRSGNKLAALKQELDNRGISLGESRGHSILAAKLADIERRKEPQAQKSPAQIRAEKEKKKEPVSEDGDSCPPATQDISLNLKNRQKAIDEYGYGPLNPDLPNTTFWMKKVDEWNLDSAEEAKQSLCGNCAAFDVRKETLDCISQGIDSDNPQDAKGVVEAGDIGYCKFLKFKCASRRTCDAWVTGGPLTDDVEENFADGKNPQDKGDSKRHGVPTKSSVSTLRKVAKQGGRKGQLAHWMANMKAGKQKNEEFDGEYDDEAGMAQSNLHTMARAVDGLLQTIKGKDNLPEWTQEKIAKAEQMLVTVWDYLLSQKEQGIDPKIAEGKTMSRAAKGNEKYGKDGMTALSKAGREGASEKKLDTIRDKHDNYNEGLRDKKDNPCWKGYKPVGTKKKSGKTVPNCVPVDESLEAKMAAAIKLLERK